MVMVGVTVAVGLGVVSYSMGLFGNLSQLAQITITSLDINAASDQVTVEFKNAGGQAATLDKVAVTIDGTTYSKDLSNSIGASTTASVTIDADWGDNDPDFEAGNSYTLIW